MKLLIIAKHFSPRNEARAIQAERMVRSLVRRNDVELKVIAGILSNNSDSSSHKLENITYVPYKESLISNIKLKLIVNQFSESYASSNWVALVEREYRKITDQWEPDIIITLSSPIDGHWVTLKDTFKNKRIFNFFSDAWPKCILPYPYCRSSIPLLSLYQKKKMKELAEQSSGFLYTNENVSPLFKKHGFKAKEEFILRHFANETNEVSKYGFDNHDGLKIISYTGSADEKRITDSLLNSLKEFLHLNQDYIMLFAGNRTQSLDNLIFDKLGSRVVCLGNLNNSQIKKLLDDSDILINTEGDIKNSPFIPSKLADYVCSGAKILSITSQNSPSINFLKLKGIVHESVANEQSDISAALKSLKNKSSLKLYDAVEYNDGIIEKLLSEIS